MPVLSIAFPGGMDESLDARLVDPQKSLISLQNGTQENGGAISKTLGYTNMTRSCLDSTTRTSGYRAFPFGDSICVVDGTPHIDVYAETATKWVPGDRMSEASLRAYPVPLSGGEIDGNDCVYANGYIFVVAWIINGPGTQEDLWAVVMDPTTYTVVRKDRLHASYSGAGLVKLAKHGTTVWAAYSTGANELSVKAFVSVASGWSSLTAISDWGGTSFGADGCYDATNALSRLVVAYKNTSGGASSLSIKTYTGANPPVLDLSVTKAAATTTTGVSALSDSSGLVIWIAYGDTAPQNYVLSVTNTALATGATAGGLIAQTSTALTMVKTGTNTGMLFATYGSSGLVKQAWTVSAGAVTASGVNETAYSCYFGARPFVVGSRYYLDIRQEGGVPWAHCVTDVTAWQASYGFRVVAYIDKGLGNRGYPDAKYLDLSSTKIGILNLTKRNSLTYGLSIAVLDFADSRRWLHAQTGETLCLSAGATQAFDGLRTGELGFIVRPGQPSVSTSGTGFTITNGVRYVAIYERINSRGEITWSATSDPSSVVTGANKTYDVAVTTLFSSSWHSSDVGTVKQQTRIVIYRTADNGGTGPYYRVGVVDNIFSAQTVSYADTTATVTSNAALYKDPGVLGTALDREAPPSSLHIFAHQDRLVALAEDGRTVFYSGPQVPGETPWFSSLQQFPIPGDGRLTSGWSQSGRMVFAKESSIYVVDGDGPPENGGNGTEFGLPRRLSSDVGCIEPRSICTTVLGTFFQSRRGIELLDGGFGVQWIGAPVRRTLATYPVITSAVLDSEEGAVLFTCVTSESAGLPVDTGVTLIYDLTTKAWSYDSNYGGLTAATSACMSTVSGKPRYHWLYQDGTNFRRNLSSDASAYLDAGSTWRTLQLETGWFKLAGLSGNALIRRVQVLCKENTDHNFKVEIGFNDRDAYEQTRTFTRSEIDAGTVDGEHVEVDVGDEARCRTVRFKITDVTPTGGTVGTGKGPTVYGLLVHYDVEEDEAFRRPEGMQ